MERSSEETRDNLRAIEKNKAAEDLRGTLITRLAKSSARLDQVIKRGIQVDMQIKELELRFREAIKELRIPPAS
jgi:ribosome-interacting GTPase 1